MDRAGRSPHTLSFNYRPDRVLLDDQVIADDEEWAGETIVHEDQRDIDRALGIGRIEYGLVSIWWD